MLADFADRMESSSNEVVTSLTVLARVAESPVLARHARQRTQLQSCHPRLFLTWSSITRYIPSITCNSLHCCVLRMAGPGESRTEVGGEVGEAV
jgi:hypothetical protein